MDGFLKELIVGSYVWTTFIGGWLWKEIKTLRSNHIRHILKDAKDLERRVTLLEKHEKER